MEKITASHRVLRVLFALSGHSLNGLSNAELAEGLGETPVNISRTLAVMVEEGAAIKLDTGRYAPGIMWLQSARAHANEMDRAQGRIMELNQRIAAGAMR